MQINAFIFREYDIRGVVEHDFAGAVPELVGRAFGSEVRRACPDVVQPVVAVGRDNRPSSPGLAEKIIRGIRAAGVKVVDLGTVPTPVLYYAVQRYGTDGGLQITGSHNPPEYNGFKMVLRGGSVYGDAIQGLRRRIEADDFASGQGELERRDPLPEYVDDLTGRFRLQRPVKVVADCGNGTGSLVAVQLLERIGADVVPLYCISDGTFPNHHPDPVVDENLEDLIVRVKEERAELGVAFDGDADRVGAVDEKGNIIRGDILLLLFGLDVLKHLGPGQKMVLDVKCSQALPEVFEAAGGKAIMWKTGHSLMKEKMKEEKAPIAGELSGHICIADGWYGFDDALYDACRLVDMVARSRTPLSQQTAAFPQYVSTPEIRLDVSEETKFDIVRRAVEHFKQSHDVIAIDGARVLFDGGWGLLRASNTQPVL
ncbi:MAG TPA: phosphomannomutase/phosphoglucomutase, partial [Longimicrobiales bacterium]